MGWYRAFFMRGNSMPDQKTNSDPAFLLYSKDWLTGTCELRPEEKGAYIDLLCYQHINGSISSDKTVLSKILGIELSAFESIWNTIKEKFILTENDRMVNRKLNRVVNQRLEHAKKNRLLGHYAMLVRQFTGKKEIISNLKKQFKLATFLNLEEKEATERITEWFTERSTGSWVDRSEDVIEDAIAIEDSSLKKGEYEGKTSWSFNSQEGFKLYTEMAKLALSALQADRAYIKERQEFHPELDIRMSLQKAWTDYWLKKAGWKNKRDKARGKPNYEIDWRATANNALTQKCNQVWQLKEDRERPNVRTITEEEARREGII